MISNVYRVPVSEWRRKYYASTKGIPSVAAIRQSIDNNEVPGNSIAGKYHVTCDHKYEPLWHLLDEAGAKKPQVKVKSALAAKILQEEGYA